MAYTVGIFAESGQGKTSSLIVNKDGTLDKEKIKAGNKEGYSGMDPASTLIINADRKPLSFPATKMGWERNKNLFVMSDAPEIKNLLIHANKVPTIKSIYIDTLNGIMLDKEMNDIKKKSYDKWADLAQEIYELIVFCNTELREDIIVYFGGHVGMFTDTDGNEAKGLLTNGRKLEKIRLETKLTVVLFGSVNRGSEGKHNYQFETQSNRSSGKSPIGMFNDFLIPNSLRLVDDTIREYEGI